MKLERMFKKKQPWFNLSCCLPGTEGIEKYRSCDSRYLGSSLNSIPPRYKAGVLNTWHVGLIFCYACHTQGKLAVSPKCCNFFTDYMALYSARQWHILHVTAIIKSNLILFWFILVSGRCVSVWFWAFLFWISLLMFPQSVLFIWNDSF